MKQWKKAAAMVLSLYLLLVLLTGCMKIELDINVKNNGKADLRLLYAMAEQTESVSGFRCPMTLIAW